MVISHELLHGIYQIHVGTVPVRRQRDEAPEGRIGSTGPASTVIVHDNYYGYKNTIKTWLPWNVSWTPIVTSYMPISRAKSMYNL